MELKAGASAPLLFDFYRDTRGDVVEGENIEAYMLSRFGIGAMVEPKHDGYIIAVRTQQSANTLMTALKYSHDYIMAHPKGEMLYAFYVRTEVIKRKDNIYLPRGKI